ncbi:hypothetical protein [Ruthenibacterium lactatiformans]|uniref:hypothetical protein n=1 Tax=Ruthenibacterium lactatiformans TaxID=1550024 RepID=UPI00242ECCE1|nr:hypothetical protein [Ruthenibacterium lactatiformans]
MAFKRITENDMLGKGNVGKPDTPGVSTSEMQRIMDELPREVIAPAFNELSGQLEANTASADIGANAPDGITPDPAPAENSPAKLQSVLQGIVNKITDHIADQVKHVTSEERTLWNNASNDRHTHDNKSILDGITSSLVGNWNAAFAHISDAVRHITENERTNWNDKYTKSETDKAINERVVEIGSSDMTKAVYDPETRNLPYIPKIDAEALTLGKNVVLSGAPVSIAYAGTNRIASITAYGENAQGGTTEAPVALTGISSITVNDDVTELPIPRPLRRVGDVKDKCVTRVKSVYDKRIVLDGTEYWFISKGVFFYKSAVTDNALTMAACDRYKFHITDNGVSGVTTDKTFAFNIATPERIMIRDDDYTSIEEFKAHLTDNPLTVYYQSTAYDGINGLDICLTEYQNGFVELDGTEYMTLGNIDASQKVQQFDIGNVLSSPKSTDAICSHISSTSSVNGESISIYDNRLLVAVWLREPLLEYGFVEGDSGTYIPAFKAYLAAQKEAGTPVQVAYQLATPETYATDPVDFDNTAGPLTVMTGGELEVRMTELVGTRSPELTGKMDRDIYFQVGNLNLGDNTNLLNPVNQQGQASYTGDSTSPYCIDRWRISNGTTYNIVSRTLTASSYANRACGMWQTNELAQQALAIGSTITFSGYINGMQHSGTIKILNRDLYSSFAEVPAGYECDDFEIVCCTASHEQSKYNLGIYPKKEAVLNWIKWEKGLYATPYAPKGFGLEQLECMRYYQTIKGIKYVLRKALASEGFPYVIPVTFMPMRAVPQTDITVTEGAENNLTATGVTQTACGIQFQPVAENVGLTFTLTLSANL